MKLQGDLSLPFTYCFPGFLIGTCQFSNGRGQSHTKKLATNKKLLISLEKQFDALGS